MKNQNTNKTQMPGDWIYFTREETTLLQIKELCQEAGYETEYWEDAQVLEILHKDCSMDVETTQFSRADEFTSTFLKEQGAVSLFLISIRPEEYSVAEEVFLAIKEGLQGEFLGDTQDLMPRF